MRLAFDLKKDLKGNSNFHSRNCYSPYSRAVPALPFLRYSPPHRPTDPCFTFLGLDDCQGSLPQDGEPGIISRTGDTVALTSTRLFNQSTRQSNQLTQFTGDFPSFSTVSPASEEAPQSLANQDNGAPSRAWYFLATTLAKDQRVMKL